VASIYVRNNFKYSSDGIRRLALLIQASLQARGWSERELARYSGITSPTASRYAKGRLKNPQTDILMAIAPFVYKAIEFPESDKVKYDQSEVYQKWEELALIATDDFEKGLKRSNGEMRDFAQMLDRAMKLNGIDQEYLEYEFEQRIQKGAFTSIERLRQIQKGEELPDFQERRILYVIVDPQRIAYSHDDWVDSQLKNPANDDLRDHDHTVSQN
jgi:transcriptional regulator with XRE-family HTH domain